MSNQNYHLGVIGLGVMGCNLLLNMAEHGLRVAGYDKNPDKVLALQNQSEGRPILAAANLKTFVEALAAPHIILLLVPAGPPVDAVLGELVPYLRPKDIVIDGGNSHFSDTGLRQVSLAEDGIYLLGVGISGGAEGARHGPCMMPGGALGAYDRVRTALEAVAAKVDGEPCVAYCGPGSSGHYVKMVHNGIEYGLMRLIAESYALMRRGLQLNDDELHSVFAEWNKSEVGGFLLEITADIFMKVDDKTGGRLIDLVRPVAGQKGTGMWTFQDAMELQVPAPTVAAAITMRDMSVFESDRIAASRMLRGPAGKFEGDRDEFIGQLRDALHAGMLLTFAQGMSLLTVASQHYGYGLRLEKIARIWRGGCIIRSVLLDNVVAAYRRHGELTSLLLDPDIAKDLSALHDSLRSVVRLGIALGVPAFGFMASLGYYDGYRTPRMAANLIQAQRDYFGAHTYERIDARGVFHTKWKPG